MQSFEYLGDLATQIVCLTGGGAGAYLTGPMKMLFLPLICVGALGLTSCGLLRTVTQVPARALQSVGRAAGFGLEYSEVERSEKGVKTVKGEDEVSFEPRVRD